MIEQGIYFALGCIVTALSALLFAPVFWRRALRLTRQRLQLQVPLSLQEILAERDQLRAEFAVERLRVEQAMERVQASKGEDMAEIGRRAAEAVALTETIAALRQIEQDQKKKIDVLLRDVAEAGAENSALHVAIHQGEAKLDVWRQRTEAEEAHRDRLLAEVDSHRTTISSLKTVGMSLEIRLVDAERALGLETDVAAGLRGRLETAMEHAARHENAGILLRRELDDAKAHRRQLEDDLSAARASVREARREHDQANNLHQGIQAEHEAATAVLRRSLDEAKTKARQLADELAVAHVALEETQEREKGLLQKQIAQAEQDKATIVLRRELDDAKTHLRQRDDELQEAQTALRDARDRDKADNPQRNLRGERDTALVSLRRDLEDAKTRGRQLEGELGAVHVSLDVARREREKVDELQRSLQAEQETTGAALRGALDEATTRVRKMEEELAMVRTSLRAAEAREATHLAERSLLAAQDSTSASLRRDLDDATAQIEVLRGQVTATQAALGEEREKATQTKRGLQIEQKSAATALRRNLDDAKTQIRTLRDELSVAQTALANVREREKVNTLQRSLQADALRRGERLVAERLDLMSAENAALTDALAAARRDGGLLVPQVPGHVADTRVTEDDADLRMSIHALGLAVAKMTRQAREGTNLESEGPRRPLKDETSRPVGVA